MKEVPASKIHLRDATQEEIRICYNCLKYDKIMGIKPKGLHMKEILLNGNKMLDKASTHDYLKQKLDFPDYYGENLDALWDLLTTDFSRKKIIIYRPNTIIENLGTYGEAIINLFKEVAKENEYIIVEIEGDKVI